MSEIKKIAICESETEAKLLSSLNAAFAENSRLTARIAELEKALKDAQQTMRNAWGAVTSNQIEDKGVAEMLKDGVRLARTNPSAMVSA